MTNGPPMYPKYSPCLPGVIPGFPDWHGLLAWIQEAPLDWGLYSPTLISSCLLNCRAGLAVSVQVRIGLIVHLPWVRGQTWRLQSLSGLEWSAGNPLGLDCKVVLKGGGREISEEGGREIWRRQGGLWGVEPGCRY